MKFRISRIFAAPTVTFCSYCLYYFILPAKRILWHAFTSICCIQSLSGWQSLRNCWSAKNSGPTVSLIHVSSVQYRYLELCSLRIMVQFKNFLYPIFVHSNVIYVLDGFLVTRSFHGTSYWYPKNESDLAKHPGNFRVGEQNLSRFVFHPSAVYNEYRYTHA